MRGWTSCQTQELILVLDDIRSFESGIEAASALRFGGELSGRYEVVQGDASIDVGISKIFHDSFQYGLYSYGQSSIELSFETWADQVAEDVLETWTARLRRWDPTNADIVNDYRSFFTIVGTHIVTGVDYGSRLALVSLWLLLLTHRFY